MGNFFHFSKLNESRYWVYCNSYEATHDSAPWTRCMKAFKKGEPWAIDFFAKYLSCFLEDDFVMASVPSHDGAGSRAPLNRLIARLAEMRGIENGGGLLLRTTRISPVKSAMRRNLGCELDSLEVPNCAEGLLNRPILLIDDITTSGWTLLQCWLKLNLANPDIDLKLMSLLKTKFYSGKERNVLTKWDEMFSPVKLIQFHARPGHVPPAVPSG